MKPGVPFSDQPAGGIAGPGSPTETCGDGVEAAVSRILAPGRIEVVVQRASACSGCHAKGICVPGEQETRVMVVRDDVGVSVGDRVLVGTTRPAAALAGGVAYGIPLVTLVGFGGLAWALAGSVAGSPARDLVAAAAAVLGAGAGLGIVAGIDRLWGRRFEIRVIRRLQDGRFEPQGSRSRPGQMLPAGGKSTHHS